MIGARRRVANPAAERVRDVYTAEYGRLAGWCTRLVGDPDLGHDIATESFVRLMDRSDSVTDARPWLYTCAGNLVKDHWRKRGREAKAYQTYDASDLTTQGHEGPDRATTITVREAVESLPDRLRMPVLLYYFADLPVAQVARQLGMSDGAVKRYLYEARATLAPMIEGVR